MAISKVQLPDNSQQSLSAEQFVGREGSMPIASLPLIPNMDNAVPKRTIEFDLANGSWHPLFTRSNTGIEVSELTDKAVYRITVTGENISHVMDCVTIFSPYIGASPQTFFYNKSISYNSGTLGFYGLRTLHPKEFNNDYPWAMEYYAANAVARHVKIEIFEDSDAITWYTSPSAAIYNSTYQTIYTTTYCNTAGLRSTIGVNVSVSSANSASYLSAYLPVYPGNASVFVVGAAITANNIAFLSSDNKVYPVSVTDAPIMPESGIFLIGANYSANAAISAAYIRDKGGSFTFSTSGASYGTFVKGQEVYLRCTMSNGAIYSDAYLSPTMEPGYTWISIGNAESATRTAYSTVGKSFLTLDANGKLTHVNGKEIAIPTKTSDLTNDSGFVTTDEQLKTEGIPQTTGGMYYPVLSTGANTGSKFVETNTGGLRYLISNGQSILILGNASNSSGSGLNRRGVIRLYNSDTSYTDISVSGAANKTVYLPSQEGTVALLSDIPTVPTKTSDLTNDSGFITNAGVTSFNGSTGAITYTAPVTSVNGNTGAVTISVPTKTSDLTNDSGFLTSAPVTSVNGATGAVTISVPTATSDLTNDSGFQSLAYTDISSASSTTALVWKTMYQWTVNPTSITVTLPSAPSDPRGEIVLKFTTGSTAPTMTWPSALKWANGEELTVEASTTYEFSIGYDMMGGWTIVGCGFSAV